MIDRDANFVAAVKFYIVFSFCYFQTDITPLYVTHIYTQDKITDTTGTVVLLGRTKAPQNERDRHNSSFEDSN